MIELILIHNGKTKGIAEQRYIGSTDESLLAEAREELARRVSDGFYPKLSAVCSSPMKRCLETAKLLYPELNPTIMQGFRPRSYGRYEGKSYVDLKDDAPYQDWVRSIGKLPFPDGEPEVAAKTRYLTAYDELVENLRSWVSPSFSYRIGLVLHREIIADILVERLPIKENALKYMLKNGDYFRISLTGSGIALIGKNTESVS